MSNKKRIAVKDMGNSSITFEANPKLWEREREGERGVEDLIYFFDKQDNSHTIL